MGPTLNWSFILGGSLVLFYLLIHKLLNYPACWVQGLTPCTIRHFTECSLPAAPLQVVRSGGLPQSKRPSYREAGDHPATSRVALGPSFLLAAPYPITLAGLKGQGKGQR